MSNIDFEEDDIFDICCKSMEFCGKTCEGLWYF